jgi:hypothetical protein
VAEHGAAYFIEALKRLDWSHGYTGDDLVNLFSNFPVGWFAFVPLDRVFYRWEDFWYYVAPVSSSTLGPEYHREQAERFLREADQRDGIGWGR